MAKIVDFLCSDRQFLGVQLQVFGSSPLECCFAVRIMVLPGRPTNEDTVDERCDSRDAFEDFIRLPLEVILGADDSKGKSAESIAAEGCVKSGEVR